MKGTTGSHLVAQVSALIDQYSVEQHDLARRLDALRRARTELRLGRSPEVVLAMLGEELGDPLEAMIGGRQTGGFPVQTGHPSDRPPAVNGLRISVALRQ